MKINSKFLTADVRLTGARFEDGRLVTEGLVKEFMPMTVEMSLDDFRTMTLLVLTAVGRQLQANLPESLRPLLARFLPAAEEPQSSGEEGL